MVVIEWIIDRVWQLFWFFLDAYYTVSGWVWPFSYLSFPFKGISDTIYSMLPFLYDFKNWVGNATAKLVHILSWDNILSLIQPYIQWGLNAWEWVKNAWSNIWGEIEQWWSYTKTEVLGWIDVAKQYAATLVESAKRGLTTLQQSWDSFATSILPNLADWSGVASLIDSTLKSWFPFYDELTYFWNDVKLFFTDPLEWVYNKLDEFFERFW